MARISDEWVVSTGLAKGKKITVYLLQAAEAMVRFYGNSYEVEPREAYLDIAEYMREFFSAAGQKSKEDADRLFSCGASFFAGMPDDRFDQCDAKLFLHEWRKLRAKEE